MFDRWLRGLKDRLLGPALRRVPVHPNVLSVIAFAVGGGAAAAAWSGRYHVALTCWLLNRTLDGVDGTLARVRGRQTDFGGYLDILLDFGVYAALPIALVAGRPSVGAIRAALALLASFYVNAASWMYLAAILDRRQADARAGMAADRPTAVTMPDGVVAGAETIVFYALFLLFPAHLAVLFSIMAALVAVTVGQRLVWAWRALR